MEAGSLGVQVRDEGGVGVAANVDRAIVIIVILGDRDSLCSGELLFQVTGDGILLLLNEGGNALAHSSLIQGLACDNHNGDESFLLLVHGSDDGLSHGVVHLPLSGGSDRDGSLLLIDGEVGGATWHGRQDGGGLGWWWWWVTMNPRVR
jgi:hypothetical protein